MKICKITMSGENLRFQLEEAVQEEKIRVSLYSPALGEEMELCSLTLTVRCDSFTVPRRLSGRDGLCLCYVTADASGEVDGKKYVENVSELAERKQPYPVASARKGLCAEMAEDAVALGVRNVPVSVNLGDFMMLYPEGENTLYYRFEGQDYYIRRNVAEYTDSLVRPLSEAGVTVYLQLLNCASWRTDVPGYAREKFFHPDSAPDAAGAMFDVVREEGCRYYRAFVSFLAQRYTREDAKYGFAPAMLIGNEINDPAGWMQCGEMTLPVYAEQYTTALRLAYQCAASVYENFRLFVPLNGRLTGGDPSDSGYPACEMLAAIASIAGREGDFPWHVAATPQCGSGEGVLSFDTLSRLVDFLSLPYMHLRGASRRLLLTECAFPSDGTASGEEKRCADFLRALNKIGEIPAVDAFFYYSHIDHAEEEGHLGLWRVTEDGVPFEKRKIYEVFRSAEI